MSLAQTHDRLQLPESLQNQLHAFQRRVWSIKMIEAVCGAAFGVVIAFLALFALDRIWETPGAVRVGLFLVAVFGCAIVPIAMHRWIWRNRHLEQLARLLARTHPHVGDQLLGIIELARSDSEQARSRTLCEAAIQQVARDAQSRDFGNAVPNPRHRAWVQVVAVPLALTAGLFAFYPAAAANAWARLVEPWKPVPRYTFAAIEPLPDRLVVAHGEPFTIVATLSETALWKPKQGTVRLGNQPPIIAALRDGHYVFDLPAQIDEATLHLHVGDSIQRLQVDPILRPELTSVVADVALPGYLGRPKDQQKDVRGGAVSLVKGSHARILATASRMLGAAQVDGKPQAPDGASVTIASAEVAGPRKLEFRWEDTFGLSGKEPFTLTITGRDDEAPSLACEDLPRQKVVLDSELLNFKVHAQDDFGVKQVGLEWRGADDNPVVKTPAKGEKLLGTGGNEKENVDLVGAFSAKSLGIEPQPIHLRVFVEDYLPGRERVYSPTYTLYVLSPEQHAIWLTEQLSKWHRQALEVRDREMQLHETNKQLRALSRDELDQPESRRRIDVQATAERANGRKLSGLVVSGEDLVKQAMRNPEFGVGHLEKWAAMLQILKDISGNRMPSVADLLKQAAESPGLASANPSNNKGMAAGIDRGNGGGKPSEPLPGPKKPPTGIPAVVDRESSQQPPDKTASAAPSKSGPKSPSLRLPETTLAGKPSSGGGPPTPASQSVDEAVQKQQDLLAEFEKIADELNRVLANLEGSTLVKRLKAASRVQSGVAGRISDHLGDAFGLPATNVATIPAKALGELAEQEAKGSQTVSTIMDDMQSYFERRQFARFKTVLDEMKALDAVGSLRQIGDDLKKENGVSIAQCEFWSDSLDRWAEDLVDPTKSGSCPGSRSKGSLPPSIVLEVLQILEGEVNLREETRVTQQARAGLASEEFGRQAQALSKTQGGLQVRVVKVGERIRDLPDGEAEFAYEIGLLGQVADVMEEARGILADPETGPPAIAAETEAIELLLKSKRINPKGGGGGGPSPGGGGRGKTLDSALALIGRGLNEKEVREDHGVSQSTGESGSSLPEEFRAGLDEYFNRLERGPAGQ
jgi:hypothetical protein